MDLWALLFSSFNALSSERGVLSESILLLSLVYLDTIF